MLRKRLCLGGAIEDCLEVCFVGLVVIGNYVCYLAIFVIFIRFGGVKRRRDALKSSFDVVMQVAREGGQL